MSSLARWSLALPVGALCLLFFFRGQLGDGFTLLFGDRHDGVIALSIMEHWANVFRGAAPWNRTAYFHPVPGTLGYNDGYLLFGLLYAPLRALGLDPFLAGEGVNLLLRALGFAGMLALLGRALRLPFPIALLGAALFTLHNGLFIRASHAQLFILGAIPWLAVLAGGALAALRAGRRLALFGWGSGFALGFALCLLTGFYMAYFAALLGAAWLVCWLALAPGAIRRDWLARLRPAALPLAGIAAIGALAMLPFLALYLPKAAETGMHPWREVTQASLLDVLHVGEQNWLWGWLVRGLNGLFRPGFPVWSERMTGFPPLLLAGFLGACLWLLRGGPADPGRRALWRALALATLATWALTLQIGEHTAWRLAYAYLPGARATRVIARYQLFLAVPVVALAMAFLASRHWPRAVLALVAGLLVLEQGNAYAPRFLDRPLELGRLRAVPRPPAGCKVFWVSAARSESRFGESTEDPYNHNTEAMLIAEVIGLPTLNGISSFNPPGWPDGVAGTPAYEAAVRAYAAHHGLEGLCALDLRRFRWAGPD
jgi:hypothetical protein